MYTINRQSSRVGESGIDSPMDMHMQNNILSRCGEIRNLFRYRQTWRDNPDVVVAHARVSVGGKVDDAGSVILGSLVVSGVVGGVM